MIRTENSTAKRIAVDVQVSAPRVLVPADRFDIRIRFLCLDSDGRQHILEIIRVLKTKEPVATVRYIGPEVDVVKKLNSGAWCPQNAHAAVMIDNVIVWEQLWKTPERTAWWLDDSLVTK